MNATPLQRAVMSLEGLAIGDALGEMLSSRCDRAMHIVSEDLLPSGPWFHTDDTEMAMTAADTVPFALWCALHHLSDYVSAVLTTIAGNGDCDTNAAIVGGIVALSAGVDSIPVHWRQAKEKLP